ncbi:MAG: hypothetical protein ACK4F4_01355 [Hylemonella sp.]|uniref:phosphoribosyltransferase-like protein n=1 Tax=Hylemonella sp. TaxID=2066020 RepID=UPI00391B8FFD
MKADQAKRLVSNLMNWDHGRATQEFAWLGIMAGYKFDHYQGYSAGHRFFVHLLQWLSQYPTQEDRETAYDLVRRLVVMITQSEMHHLVNLSGPVIERSMRKAVATMQGILFYETYDSEAAIKRLQLLRERTLYVGVSDGARIDVFRRFYEGRISNEQVIPMAEISETKRKNLLGKLSKRLTKLGIEAEATFEWICLIDDFTGSGTSSIRKEESGEWDGKVAKFINGCNEGQTQLLSKDAHILVHHYLASAQAAENVSSELQKYQIHNAVHTFSATFSHVLKESDVISASAEPKLAELLHARYDPSIEDEHTKEDIWLGFKKGGLPIILEHNCPNNSVATLWARTNPGGKKYSSENPLMSPLFPRRQRHLDVR